MVRAAIVAAILVLHVSSAHAAVLMFDSNEAAWRAAAPSFGTLMAAPTGLVAGIGRFFIVSSIADQPAIDFANLHREVCFGSVLVCGGPSYYRPYLTTEESTTVRAVTLFSQPLTGGTPSGDVGSFVRLLDAEGTVVGSGAICCPGTEFIVALRASMGLPTPPTFTGLLSDEPFLAWEFRRSFVDEAAAQPQVPTEIVVPTTVPEPGTLLLIASGSLLLLRRWRRG